ncbi:MAG: glycerophosphodiester phosphodiesterase [Flavobacteriaceae bacterium]
MKTINLIFLTILMSACTLSTSKHELYVIGHRGAMGYETENTLASIDKAVELGVPMIEIDVFKIASGELVVFHDDEVDKLTDGSGPIEAMNLEEVKALTLEGGHRIPTLIDVLDTLNARTSLNIELKGSNTADDSVRIVREYIESQRYTLDQFVFSSFKWGELERVRELDKSFDIAVLTGEDPPGEDPLDAISIAEELNAIAINPWFKRVTAENVQAIHDAGFKVFTYTVNELEDIALMRSYKVDGIFCNYPDRALAQ